MLRDSRYFDSLIVFGLCIAAITLPVELSPSVLGPILNKISAKVFPFVEVGPRNSDF